MEVGVGRGGQPSPGARAAQGGISGPGMRTQWQALSKWLIYTLAAWPVTEKSLLGLSQHQATAGPLGV